MERLVRGWRREAGSWFQTRGETYWKERSIIRREDDVDGRASVTKDEQQVLCGGWTVTRLWRYEGCMRRKQKYESKHLTLGGLTSMIWSKTHDAQHLKEVLTLCWDFLFIYLFVYFAKRQPFTSKAIHHRRLNEFAEQ